MVERNDQHGAAHGGILERELATLGLEPAQVLDFSVNINPYGPCPAMRDALTHATIERYPDPQAWQARTTLATSLGVTAEQIVLGDGATQLLWQLALLFSQRGLRPLLVEPCFSELGRALRAHGVSPHALRTQARAQFALDFEALSAAVREARATLVYLCAPGAPTGAYVSARSLASWAEQHPELTVLVDQSFLLLSDHHVELAQVFPPNVICLRSLTKEHAIPGVRAGYLVAAPELARSLEANRPSWAVSAFAQAAVMAACNTQQFVAESRTRLLADREQLVTALAALGIACVPSTTSFCLAHLPARFGNATTLRERLLREHAILVRDCTSFGLPEHVRLGARAEADRARLLTALQALQP